mmetsp:Transcript_25210/g.38803  ORF Transcript_25210/g.38803 Transcript_25210/m.38803 type:complete len:317 (+) Transcript_25210:120-1070(+)|eukprot:CAMPEP_0195295128 /NCGR_PEP_ID=MMETSP0707-20130614/16656_1 /TAXON_ID=33640 /ORGANISM="Asterionellopsis glacialis, Strain CCMP134" /LENGTH=316 /DNA_ID=CAMNT_0040356277 /DNA_START=22 /DNA_END=972 /DNA_ORIENTATION=+
MSNKNPVNFTTEEKKVDGCVTSQKLNELHVDDPAPTQQPHILPDVKTNSTDDGIETSLSHERDNTEALTVDVEPSAVFEEMTQDFVEQFDTTFNDFIGANPKFLVQNPDLVHRLRIAKLRSALKRGDEVSEELTKQLAEIKSEQRTVELNFTTQLKEASKKKAALDIQVHKQLIDIQRECRLTEGEFAWALVEGTQRQVKREARLRQTLEESKKELPQTREELLKLLPEKEPEFYSVFEAANATESRGSSEEEIRQCHMDVAFLHGEVAMLKKKLGYQKQIAEKNKWVEKILHNLDDATMKSMKEKYQKKVSAPQD